MSNQKQETAKEILDRNHQDFVNRMGVSCIHTKDFPGAYREQALSAIREIADKAWEAGADHQYDQDFGTGRKPNKSTFMKELFPEDKTGHSES